MNNNSNTDIIQSNSTSVMLDLNKVGDNIEPNYFSICF